MVMSAVGSNLLALAAAFGPQATPPMTTIRLGIVPVSFAQSDLGINAYYIQAETDCNLRYSISAILPLAFAPPAQPEVAENQQLQCSIGGFLTDQLFSGGLPVLSIPVTNFVFTLHLPYKRCRYPHQERISRFLVRTSHLHWFHSIIEQDIRPLRDTMHSADWEVLGIEPGASVTQIKRAFRRRVKSNHPDVCPGDDLAEYRLKCLVASYQRVLSDATSCERVEHLFHQLPTRNTDGSLPAPMDTWFQQSLRERINQSLQTLLLISVLAAPFFALYLGGAALQPLINRVSARQAAETALTIRLRGVAAPTVSVVKTNYGELFVVSNGSKSRAFPFHREEH